MLYFPQNLLIKSIIQLIFCMNEADKQNLNCNVDYGKLTFNHLGSPEHKPTDPFKPILQQKYEQSFTSIDLHPTTLDETISLTLQHSSADFLCTQEEPHLKILKKRLLDRQIQAQHVDSAYRKDLAVLHFENGNLKLKLKNIIETKNQQLFDIQQHLKKTVREVEESNQLKMDQLKSQSKQLRRENCRLEALLEREQTISHQAESEVETFKKQYHQLEHEKNQQVDQYQAKLINLADKMQLLKQKYQRQYEMQTQIQQQKNTIQTQIHQQQLTKMRQVHEHLMLHLRESQDHGQQQNNKWQQQINELRQQNSLLKQKVANSNKQKELQMDHLTTSNALLSQANTNSQTSIYQTKIQHLSDRLQSNQHLTANYQLQIEQLLHNNKQHRLANRKDIAQSKLEQLDSGFNDWLNLEVRQLVELLIEKEQRNQQSEREYQETVSQYQLVVGRIKEQASRERKQSEQEIQLLRDQLQTKNAIIQQLQQQLQHELKQHQPQQDQLQQQHLSHNSKLLQTLTTKISKIVSQKWSTKTAQNNIHLQSLTAQLAALSQSYDSQLSNLRLQLPQLQSHKQKQLKKHYSNIIGHLEEDKEELKIRCGLMTETITRLVVSYKDLEGQMEVAMRGIDRRNRIEGEVVRAIAEIQDTTRLAFGNQQ